MQGSLGEGEQWGRRMIEKGSGRRMRERGKPKMEEGESGGVRRHE